MEPVENRLKSEDDMKKSLFKICITVFFIMFCVSLSSVHAKADSYTYDEKGQIKEIIHDDGSKTVYTYDKNGNMLSVKTISKVVEAREDDFCPLRM